MDDCRNTDNAWLETTVINIHLDRQEELMTDLNCLVSVCLVSSPLKSVYVASEAGYSNGKETI